MVGLLWHTSGLAATTPVGWATIGGIAVGSALTWGFNKAYDSNFMGIQDTVDKAGEKINEFTDNVGEAIHGTLDAMNPFS